MIRGMSLDADVVSGLRHALRDRADLALRDFDRALAHDPGHVVARQGRAAALMALGDYAGAYATTLSVLADRRGSRWWPRPAKATRGEPFVRSSAVKLRHDRDQLRHLADQSLLPSGAAALIPAFDQVLAEIEESTRINRVVDLSPAQRQRLADGYNRVVHLDPGHRVPGAAVAAAWDRDDAAGRYRRERIAVVDGLFVPEALAALRRFCLDSTIWFDTEHARGARGYIGADGMDGLACPLLFQIAEELRRALPEVIGGLPLIKLWAFKYDHALQGIGAHADAARINVNFWITPDEACIDPTIGGMTVYDKPVPADWNFESYNADPAALLRHVRAVGADAIQVPYRQNRAVIFDSALIHATQPLRFRSGYANRRINLTLLYGRR
jgi:hypothetical protein